MYKVQSFGNVIGTPTVPVTLQGSYHADVSGIIDLGKHEALTLYIGYTMGAAETSNTIQVKLEFSPDSEHYFREVGEVVVAGTDTVSLLERTFAATQTAGTYDLFRLPIGIADKPLCDASVKIWVKETGVASAAGSVYVMFGRGGV